MSARVQHYSDDYDGEVSPGVSSQVPHIGMPRPLAQWEIDRARRTVASWSLDASDCRELLAALGLLHVPAPAASASPGRSGAQAP